MKITVQGCTTALITPTTENGVDYESLKRPIALQCELLPLIKALFSQVNPVPVKAPVKQPHTFHLLNRTFSLT